MPDELAHEGRRRGGVKPGTTTAENAENAENAEPKKRIRLLEQENEVLRRAAAYLSQANLPGNDASMPSVKSCSFEADGRRSGKRSA